MLVIANEISPKFFGQHLIATALSKNRNLKIIIVPKLKDATKSLFKVPPVAFSLKNSLKFPEFDDFYSKLGIHAELLKHYCLIQDSINVSVKKEKKEDSDESTQPQVTLLTKTSDSSRSFIPIGTEEVVPAPAPPETPMDTSDFISLSKYDSPSDFLSSSSATPLYRPLKFMKIAGNSNRKKKWNKQKLYFFNKFLFFIFHDYFSKNCLLYVHSILPNYITKWNRSASCVHAVAIDTRSSLKKIIIKIAIPSRFPSGWLFLLLFSLHINVSNIIQRLCVIHSFQFSSFDSFSFHCIKIQTKKKYRESWTKLSILDDALPINYVLQFN